MPVRFVELMKMCWAQDAKDRPTITDIVQELHKMINGVLNPIKMTAMNHQRFPIYGKVSIVNT